MKLNFRQGLHHAPLTGGHPSFLTYNPGNNSITVSVGVDLVRASAAWSDVNYVIEERANAVNAWGPLVWNSAWGPNPGLFTSYLYWDLNLSSGVVTRGYSPVLPGFDTRTPLNPALDQHWFDLNVNTMKVWDGVRWNQKIRVFAGSFAGGTGVITERELGTQVAIYYPGNQQSWPDHGYVIFGIDQKGIHNSDGSFVTTAVPINTYHGSFSSPIRLELANSTALAAEPIPAFYAVSNTGMGTVVLANGTVVASRPVGIAMTPVITGDPVDIVTHGILYNDQWNWNVANGEKDLYCGTSGELVQGSVVFTNGAARVGTILGPQTILLAIDLYGIGIGGVDDDSLSVENISHTVTDYVLQPSDLVNKMVRISPDFGTITYVSVPNDTHLSAPIGTQVIVSSNGTGIIELRAQLGAVVHSPQSLQIDRRYGRVVLIKVEANKWEIDGQLVAQVQLNIQPVNPQVAWIILSNSFAYPADSAIQHLGAYTYDGIHLTADNYFTDPGIRLYGGLQTGSVTFANVSVHGKYLRATVESGGVTLISTGATGYYGVLEGVWSLYTTNDYLNNPRWKAAATWAQCQPPYTPYYTLLIDVSDTPSADNILGSFRVTVNSSVLKHINQNFVTNHNPSPISKSVSTSPTGTLWGDNDFPIGSYTYDATAAVSSTAAGTFTLDVHTSASLVTQIGISKVDASLVDQSSAMLAHFTLGNMISITGQTSTVWNSFRITTVEDSGTFFTLTISTYEGWNSLFTPDELCVCLVKAPVAEVFTHPEFPYNTMSPWFYKFEPTVPLPSGVTSSGSLHMGTEYSSLSGNISFSGPAQTIEVTMTVLIDNGSIQILTTDTFNLETDGTTPPAPPTSPIPLIETIAVTGIDLSSGVAWYTINFLGGDLIVSLTDGGINPGAVIFDGAGNYYSNFSVGTTTLTGAPADLYYLAVAETASMSYDYTPWNITANPADGSTVSLIWGVPVGSPPLTILLSDGILESNPNISTDVVWYSLTHVDTDYLWLSIDGVDTCVLLYNSAGLLVGQGDYGTTVGGPYQLTMPSDTYYLAVGKYATTSWSSTGWNAHGTPALGDDTALIWGLPTGPDAGFQPLIQGTANSNQSLIGNGLAWYSVDYTGGDFTVTLAGSDGDTYMLLYDSTGYLIQEDDDSGGGVASAFLSLAGLTPQTYYVAVGILGDMRSYHIGFGAYGTVSHTETIQILWV